jgi:hypothetical protein
MSDALPQEYGVNAAGPRARAGMLPEQRRAHERLATLPKRVISRTERDEMARQLRAQDFSEALSRARKGSEKAYAAVAKAKQRMGTTINTVAQKDLILAALRQGPLTPAEIAERFAAGRPSARIGDLRDAGHVIETQRSADGGYLYVLRKEAANT